MIGGQVALLLRGGGGGGGFLLLCGGGGAGVLPAPPPPPPPVPPIERRLSELPKNEVVRRLREANVPVGPISDLHEVFTDPVVRHLGLIAEVDHPVAGSVRAPGIPVRMDGTPPSVRRHPPVLGEHTDEVLSESGYTPEEILALRREGVV